MQAAASTAGARLQGVAAPIALLALTGAFAAAIGLHEAVA